MLHCHLDRYAICHSLAINNIFVQRSLAAVQIFNELLDSSFIMEYLFNWLFLRSFIPKYDFQPLGEERHLAETLLENIIIKHGFLENSVIWEECNFSTGLIRLAFPNDCQFLCHFSAFITLLVYLSFTKYLNFQPIRQSIYDRGSNAMKASGYLVASSSKLSACMKYGKYDFYCRKSCLMVDSNRNSTSVINNRYRVVFINTYQNSITESCQCLIHSIINNLIYQMMKSAG